MEDVRSLSFDLDGDGEERVIMRFNCTEMSAQEVFMKWVGFMNAIGYPLDAVEMEKMWNGEYDDSEETEFLKAQVKDYENQIERLKQDLYRCAENMV